MSYRFLQTLGSSQFVVFIAGGALSALVDIGSMALCLHSGVGALMSVTTGFVSGLVVNYLFHVRLTFASRMNLSSLLRFLTLVGVNYGITLGFVFASQSMIESTMIGKVASLPIVAINGFLLSKFWAFK